MGAFKAMSRTGYEKIQRIRYDSNGESLKIFYTKFGEYKVKLDLENLTFAIISPKVNKADGTRKVHVEGSAGSVAVLKRKAKAALEEILQTKFDVEERPERQGKIIGGLPRKNKND